MIKWLGASIVAMLMVIVLISQEQAGAGMAPVGDEDLAEITAQTGINLYGSLKATAGNLIIASTAGRLKLGGWRLNNATPATADPSNSASVGFSQWGPFSINVGYFNSPTQGKRAVLRIGLDARVNENAPTWIFKNIQMWQDEDWSDYSGEPYFDGTDCLRDQPSTGYLWNYNWDSSNTLTHLVEGTYAGGHNNYSASNHGEAGWIDIGGLYLTSIHLWQSYIDLFNDSATSVSQIQGYGRFFRDRGESDHPMGGELPGRSGGHRQPDIQQNTGFQRRDHRQLHDSRQCGRRRPPCLGPDLQFPRHQRNHQHEQHAHLVPL